MVWTNAGEVMRIPNALRRFAERHRSRNAGVQSLPPADGRNDAGPFDPIRAVLPVAIAMSLTVCHHLHLHRNDFVVEQPMCQLTGDLRLCVSLLEVAGGRFDGMGQFAAQRADARPFDVDQRRAKRCELPIDIGRFSQAAVAGDVSATTQILAEDFARFVPGALFQLKAEAVQVPIEQLARIDVAGQQHTGFGGHEDGKRRLAADATTRFGTDRQPTEVVRTGQQQPVVTFLSEELGDLLMSAINLVSTVFVEHGDLTRRHRSNRCQ